MGDAGPAGERQRGGTRLRYDGFAPCFPVRDLEAALRHYGRLGFTVLPYEPGMEWGWVRYGTAELHLFLKADHDPARTAAAADMAVENVELVERVWSATGVVGTSDVYETPYGREFVHIDQDNNLIRVISPLD